HQLHLDVRAVSRHTEGGAGEDRAAVRFVQVSPHAGDIADVVADVVGNCGGVAGIVFGNPGLDFADQVRPDVGRLGENATADAGEQRLAAGPHPEAEHGDGDRLQIEVVPRHRGDPGQRGDPQADVSQYLAAYVHAPHGPA